MITEDYVSFKIAKLLKEKGFDEECSYFYNNIDYGTPGLEVDGQLYYKNSALDDEEYAAPTLQMAMKWLREEKNFFIEIQCYGCEANEKAHFEYSYVIREYVTYNNEICKVVGLVQKHGKSRFNSYEEACEAAIKYCLENLV